MQVFELMQKLLEFPPDLEVVVCRNGTWQGHDLHDMDDVHTEHRTLGLCTPNPETKDVVVLDTGSCGL